MVVAHFEWPDIFYLRLSFHACIDCRTDDAPHRAVRRPVGSAGMPRRATALPNRGNLTEVTPGRVTSGTRRGAAGDPQDNQPGPENMPAVLRAAPPDRSGGPHQVHEVRVHPQVTR
ncbi:hypothetical protein GCM10028790_02180 [Micromonospora taraxaci]